MEHQWISTEALTLQRYLAGDLAEEAMVVRCLRRIGEAAARSYGLQEADVDAAGVDFAASALQENAARIRGCRGDILAYLRQAARWHASSSYRSLRRKREVSIGLSVDPAVRDHGTAEREFIAQIAYRHTASIIQHVVPRLPPSEQEVYRVCILEGLNSVEASKRLQCSPPAARKRLQRLREHLKTIASELYLGG